MTAPFEMVGVEAMDTPDTSLTSLRGRLGRVKGERPIAWLASLAEVHRETMRRYLTGQSPPSATALMQICARGEINPDWLLLGRGPMRREPRVSEATPTELLSSLATWIERSNAPDAA